jgi:putative DNA-binding protein
MPALAEIQSYFRNAVIDRDGRSIASMLLGGRQPEKRLNIHQRNYHTSLVDALLVKFPATSWLIGPQFLTEAATRFVRKQPPQAPCIVEYGSAFPDFLISFAGPERMPYLKDFAELERLVGQVAIALDHPAISAESFSNIPADALPDTRLNLQPGLCYLKTSWPVDELMKLYLTEMAPDQFQLVPADIWIEVRGARGEFDFNRLREADLTFRKSVSQGCSIGDAAERALDANPGFDPGRALAGLIADGLVIAILDTAGSTSS